MALRLNFSIGKSLQDGAALIFGMGAACKLTATKIGQKFREAEGQLLFPDDFALLQIQRGKTWRIRHKAIRQVKNFGLPGSVPPTPQLAADFTSGQMQGLIQAIEQRGFSHARIPCKGAELSS